MALPRVLITRSAHQSSALAEELRALGAEPVMVPAIELTEPTSFAVLDDAVARLEVFHWVLFTSANAVEAFAKRAGVRLNSVQKVAAIGPATARAVEAAGLRVDLMPVQAVAESLVEALQPFLYQEDGSATRFLLVRAEVAREYLPDALRERGAVVTIAPAYRNVIPEESVLAIQELFHSRETWPDAITFTSSSSATNLLVLLEVTGLELPAEVLRVSIGPVTSRTLEDAGYPPHAEAKTPTIPELARAVIQVLASGNTDK
jgi:uroporphyrinogen-III synthase